MLYTYSEYALEEDRLVNSEETLIMTEDYVVLKEGNGYQELYIKDGYLDLETVYIQFRGNTYL